MIATRLMAATRWEQIRTLIGPAVFVPDAARDLFSAASAEEAEQAYWRLDNRVVAQGQLFESARWVVGPLLAGISVDSPDFVREHVANMLVEIANGESDEEEIAAGGDQDLAERCREELRGGLWIFYRMLEDSVPMVRLSALEVLDIVERDRHRLIATIAFMERDPDPKVAVRASSLIGFDG